MEKAVTINKKIHGKNFTGEGKYTVKLVGLSLINLVKRLKTKVIN